MLTAIPEGWVKSSSLRGQGHAGAGGEASGTQPVLHDGAHFRTADPASRIATGAHRNSPGLQISDEVGDVTEYRSGGEVEAEEMRHGQSFAHSGASSCQASKAVRICRPSAFPSGIGTALPICRAIADFDPTNL